MKSKLVENSLTVKVYWPWNFLQLQLMRCKNGPLKFIIFLYNDLQLQLFSCV